MGYQALVHHRINQRLTSRFLNVDELKDWSGSMLMSRGMQFDWQFSNASPPLLTHVMEVCHPRRKEECRCWRRSFFRVLLWLARSSVQQRSLDKQCLQRWDRGSLMRIVKWLMQVDAA